MTGPADEQDARPGLHPALEPLAWLLGTYEGVGALVYPTIEDRNYVQRVDLLRTTAGRSCTTPRGPGCSSDDGSRGRPGASEEGWWRPGAGKFDVEVLLSHPFGVQELLVGTVAFQQVTLASDAVVRTATAKDVTATSRLYGGVDGDLAYVVEMAAVGQPLQPHLSARLARLPEDPPAA